MDAFQAYVKQFDKILAGFVANCGATRLCVNKQMKFMNAPDPVLLLEAFEVARAAYSMPYMFLPYFLYADGLPTIGFYCYFLPDTNLTTLRSTQAMKEQLLAERRDRPAPTTNHSKDDF